MLSIAGWRQLPPRLAGLLGEVAQRTPGEVGVHELAHPEEAPPSGANSIVMVFGGRDDSAPQRESDLDMLQGILGDDSSDVVVVVGDSFLGSDATNPSPVRSAAAAVALVRSKSVRRGATCRANVVCVPALLLGGAASQRGPLALQPDLVDVAEAVAFFIDPANGYLNGQVLQVNGGRHLFSSLTA